MSDTLLIDTIARYNEVDKRLHLNGQISFRAPKTMAEVRKYGKGEAVPYFANTGEPVMYSIEDLKFKCDYAEEEEIRNALEAKRNREIDAVFKKARKYLTEDEIELIRSTGMMVPFA